VSDVHRVLSGYKPGETVPVSVLRDREEEKVQVALGDSSATPKPQVANPQGMPGHGNYGQGFHGSQSMMSKHRCHRDNG